MLRKGRVFFACQQGEGQAAEQNVRSATGHQGRRPGGGSCMNKIDYLDVQRSGKDNRLELVGIVRCFSYLRRKGCTVV